MTDSPETEAADQAPLGGIRVIDLSRLVAGNMLSLQLADFGADVVKVEPLPAGDTLRAWREDGHSIFWKVYCRNKRSLGLNFRQDGAIDILRRLAARADVLIESFRPGTLETMGLAPDTLLADNPGLVVIRISGFGQTGPYAQRPGFGTLMEAMSGFAARNGFPDREPVLPPMQLADMLSGLYGAFATMTALRARDMNGAGGQVIDLSLLESMITSLGPEAGAHKATGRLKPRVGSGSNNAAPRNVYRTKDGKWVAISGSTQKPTERLFLLMGHGDLLSDPRFADNSARVAHRGEVDTLVGAWIGERDRAEALAIFEREGITAGPVYDEGDLVNDAHVLERGVFFDLPDADLESVFAHAPVPRFSKTPGQVRRPAPRLGENSREVLHDYGFAEAEIARLTSDALIREESLK